MTCSSLSVFYCLTNVLEGENGRWWKKRKPLHGLIKFRSKGQGGEKMTSEDEMMRGKHLLNKVNKEKDVTTKVGKWQMKTRWWEDISSVLHCPEQHPREQRHNVIQIEPNQRFTTTSNWIKFDKDLAPCTVQHPSMGLRTQCDPDRTKPMLHNNILRKI